MHKDVISCNRICRKMTMFEWAGCIIRSVIQRTPVVPRNGLSIHLTTDNSRWNGAKKQPNKYCPMNFYHLLKFFGGSLYQRRISVVLPGKGVIIEAADDVTLASTLTSLRVQICRAGESSESRVARTYTSRASRVAIDACLGMRGLSYMGFGIR